MVIDFSTDQKRYSGNNYEIKHRLDDYGMRWSIVICYKFKPRIADFILLKFERDNIRIVIVEKVTVLDGLQDIYILEVNTRKAEALYMGMVYKRIKEFSKK